MTSTVKQNQGIFSILNNILDHSVIIHKVTNLGGGGHSRDQGFCFCVCSIPSSVVCLRTSEFLCTIVSLKYQRERPSWQHVLPCILLLLFTAPYELNVSVEYMRNLPQSLLQAILTWTIRRNSTPGTHTLVFRFPPIDTNYSIRLLWAIVSCLGLNIGYVTWRT